MKITRKTNFRVVVEPRRLGDYGYVRTSDTAFGRSIADVERDYEERCEGIAQDIKRHADNIGRVSVECDSEEQCQHCGHRWEVSVDDSDSDFPKGTPLCCQRAITEHQVLTHPQPESQNKE